MLNKSESIANLVKALSTLQGELRDADKNALNPHFKSKYADLSEVLGNLRPLLAKNQLALSQFPSFENGIVSVTSLLAHASGEWIESTASAPATKSDVQGVGSAITYLKRYSATAIVGMASADNDDDGNSVSHNPNVPPQVMTIKNDHSVLKDIKKPKTEVKALTDAEVTKLETIIQTYAKSLLDAGLHDQVNAKIDAAREASRTKPFNELIADLSAKINTLKAMTKKKTPSADIKPVATTDDLPF